MILLRATVSGRRPCTGTSMAVASKTTPRQSQEVQEVNQLMSAHCGASLVVGVRMAINKCRNSSSFSSLLFLLVSFPPLSFLFSSLLAFPILSPLLSSPRFLSNLLCLLFLVSSVSSLLTPLSSPPLRSPRPSQAGSKICFSLVKLVLQFGGAPPKNPPGGPPKAAARVWRHGRRGLRKPPGELLKK